MRTNRKLYTVILLTAFLAAAFTLQAQPRRVLNLKDLQMGPNPFSPYSEFSYNGEVNFGLHVRFEVESYSRFVWLTVRVHNMDGTVVRTIFRREPKYTDENKMEPALITFWWDGRDDYGNLANNGRYLLHLSVSDTEAETFSTEKLKQVVLVK